MNGEHAKQPVAAVAESLMRTCYDEANRLANHGSNGLERLVMHNLYEAANEAKARLAAAADDSAKASSADKPAFACSAWLALAVGWEAEAMELDMSLDDTTLSQYDRDRAEIRGNTLQQCCDMLRRVVEREAAKANKHISDPA